MQNLSFETCHSYFTIQLSIYSLLLYTYFIIFISYTFSTFSSFLNFRAQLLKYHGFGME
jgi:hypothetical protein